MVGTIRHTVHFVHFRARLLQQGLEQAAPGNGHHSAESVSIRVAQIVQDDPSRAANIGVTDDVEYLNHTNSPPSGIWLRRADSAPIAR